MAFEKLARPVKQKEQGTGVRASVSCAGGGRPCLRLYLSAERMGDFDVRDAGNQRYSIAAGTGEDAGRIRISVDTNGVFEPKATRGSGYIFSIGELPGYAEPKQPTWCGWRQIDDFTLEIALPWNRLGQPVAAAAPDPARALVDAARAKKARPGIGSYR